MLILAVDQSTANGSLALLDNGVPVAEYSWEENGRDNRLFFASLNRAFKEQNITPDAIDLFTVGLGPGTFAGLRISLSAIRAMALPGQKPVLGISSGEAIAVETFTRTGRGNIIVLGDARRGHIWHAQFLVSASDSGITRNYSLTNAESIATVMTPDCAIATPDWPRLADMLSLMEQPDRQLVRERILPTATSIGRIAARRHSKAAPGEIALTGTDILSPIYMHPPVSVAPRFV